MKLTKSKLNKLRKKVHAYYKSIDGIYSPYFKGEVVFNAQGFMHLIYEGSRQQRSTQEQYLRLRMLPKGVKMLQITTVVQEYEERKVNNKIQKFWGFIGIIDGAKIKVVVRQKGNGKIHFYSIFPKWITRMSIEK